MDTQEAGDAGVVLTQSPASSPPLPAPVTRPSLSRSPGSFPISSLPPLVTSPHPHSVSMQRLPSYASKRLSTWSNNSGHPSMSRPQSQVFPLFHSSLPYALVRDFAYPSQHHLHYGPPLDQPSDVSTPVSEYTRRVSDPLNQWSTSKSQWSGDASNPDPAYMNLRLPSRSFGDGPPYAEDEDLLSPIVTSSKHRKSKSSTADYDYFRRSGHRRSESQDHRTAFAGTNSDGSETYYVVEGNESANGPGGEYVTYHRRKDGAWHQPGTSGQHYSHPDGQAEDELTPSRSPRNYDDYPEDESRYSREYQFTIASPDEEMHGKAVALFDFERENDNELPFVEGQVLWVSYRHGEGWLVAQDPKSGESGLIPEEYVRLLRDIEGGLNGLKGTPGGFDAGSPTDELESPPILPPSASSGFPFQQAAHERASSGNGSGYQRYTPIVSHFSTSSKDLEPYTQHHLLGSQQNTPMPASDAQFAARGGDVGGGELLRSDSFKQDRLPVRESSSYDSPSGEDARPQELYGPGHLHRLSEEDIQPPPPPIELHDDADLARSPER